MVDIETLSIVVAASSVVAGVVYSILEMRHQSRTRYADLVVRLTDRTARKEYKEATIEVQNAEFKDLNDFEGKYGKLISKKAVPMAVLVVCNFYEQLGVLVQRKAVDARLIYQLFPVDVYWEKLKPVIEGVRQRTGTLDIMSGSSTFTMNSEKKCRKKSDDNGWSNVLSNQPTTDRLMGKYVVSRAYTGFSRDVQVVVEESHYRLNR